MAPLLVQPQQSQQEPQTAHAFILEQELPGLEEAVKRGAASLLDRNPHGCPHWGALFPHLLSVQLVPFSSSSEQQQHPSGVSPVYRIQDPIAALHLQSQLEEDGALLGMASVSRGTTPLLYGDEEERRNCLCTQGIPQVYHSYIHLPMDDPAPPVPSNSLSVVSAAAHTKRNTETILLNRRVPEAAENAEADSCKNIIPDGHSSVHQEETTLVPVDRDQDGRVPPLDSIPSTGEWNRSATSNTTSSILPTSNTLVQETVAQESMVMESVASGETVEKETDSTVKKEDYFLSESTYAQYEQMEEQILQIRQNVLSKRSKKKNFAQGAPNLPPPPKPSPQPIPPSQDASSSFVDTSWYYDRQQQVVARSERLLEQYRSSRRKYWCAARKGETAAAHRPVLRAPLAPHAVPFGSLSLQTAMPAANAGMETTVEDPQWTMQCLECSHIGFDQEQCRRHFLSTNHPFAVSCGATASIYCFSCREFVNHEVFSNEKHRIDVMETLPWMAWRDHSIYRSFDALQFFHIRDTGIVWKGMKATYPILVSKDHFRATKLCRERFILFHGQVDHLASNASRAAVDFTTQQQALELADRHRIPAPIGLYNLGNTCFMSAILHCLIHCVPLQQYFIRDIGHCHQACNIYCNMSTKPVVANARDSQAKAKAKLKTVCLACEMDKLFLRYMGSCRGIDLLALVDASATILTPTTTTSTAVDEDVSNNKKDFVSVKGSPLLTAEMLAAAWKCGGMNHLAGYEQRDAHEFLHGFLETLGKHIRQFRDRVRATVHAVQTSKPFVNADDSSSNDEIKNLFEGTLRSVLVCCDCGSKRMQSESFMSISLPLSAETSVTPGDDNGPLQKNMQRLTVESCLRHFTMPEMLTDPVFCPTCSGKTRTKKQHVVSKLPKVLCLHLKRFDAAHNKKIEEFVSFPSNGLNMGPFLPHWCEVSMSAANDIPGNILKPEISYDLFATVNHFGNLQSGHYVTNVKVKQQWYHCNDSFVGFASEEEILRSDGAYLLFYIRR